MVGLFKSGIQTAVHIRVGMEDHGVVMEDHGVVREDHCVVREDHGVVREDHGVVWVSFYYLPTQAWIEKDNSKTRTAKKRTFIGCKALIWKIKDAIDYIVE